MIIVVVFERGVECSYTATSASVSDRVGERHLTFGKVGAFFNNFVV